MAGKSEEPGCMFWLIVLGLFVAGAFLMARGR